MRSKYSLSQKDEVLSGIGHRAEEHRASGIGPKSIGHRASGRRASGIGPKSIGHTSPRLRTAIEAKRIFGLGLLVV